ncbi:HAD family hydrolase [Rhodothermus marinus]|uniref:HAD family hydrolase n=1 Tax=Rhodothermus marinus TaxID=29549 RepID=UPI0037CB6BDF
MQKLVDVPLLICDFDGTLAKLRMDWNLLKSRLGKLARKKGISWQENERIDDNLRKIRVEYGESIFNMFCNYIAKEEMLSFDSDLICKSLYSVLHRRKGRPYAIVSSNTRQAIEKIFLHPIWNGLQPYIVGKEDVYYGKPDPEGLIKVCNHFGFSSQQAIYIGNTWIDRCAASAIGITFIHIKSIQ